MKRLGRGDVEPIVRRLERQMDRAERHAVEQGVGERAGSLVRDVGVIAGVSLTMLGIKALKVLPAIPFAPGHKLIILTPLYIVASLLTRSRFGATLTGLVMGTVAFLLGDGRYGIFEILKHVTPGLICDLTVPLLMRGGREPGPVLWTLEGALIGAGRFATIFTITLAVQPPSIAWAILIPGATVHTTFGALSGYVSYHLVKAIARLRARVSAETGLGTAAGGGETQRHHPPRLESHPSSRGRMSKLVTGDGRTHIASSLMRESLVDKRVIAKTQSDREYEIMPDVALVIADNGDGLVALAASLIIHIVWKRSATGFADDEIDCCAAANENSLPTGALQLHSSSPAPSTTGSSEAPAEIAHVYVRASLLPIVHHIVTAMPPIYETIRFSRSPPFAARVRCSLMNSSRISLFV